MSVLPDATTPPDATTSASDTSAAGAQVIVGLNAVVVAVTGEEPRVLVVRRVDHTLSRQVAPAQMVQATAAGDTALEALPFGPFDPDRHRTLNTGLRSWVEEQTDLKLGYVEQLYTFGDRGRDPMERRGGPRVVSIGYLALVREADPSQVSGAHWQPWYHFFPWEDWRDGRPPILTERIDPLLEAWAEAASEENLRQRRRDRIRLTFGVRGGPWNDEWVLERYELLYEADLVPERFRAGDAEALERAAALGLGEPMVLDHRRILATAMGRLRAKIKYRPVVFELMPPTFTLLRLQRVVEALAGVPVHKQNFRRLVERNGLVEGTGRIESQTGGRPAEVFRFREEVLLERLSPGLKLPGPRSIA